MTTAIPLILSMQIETSSPAEFVRRISTWTILQALLILVVVFVLVRLGTALLEALARKVPRSRFFFNMLAPIMRFALWIGGLVLILLAVFAPSPQTMWAVFTAVGVALGLGAQDLVKNVIGGLVILADRPYQLGDRVRIGDAYGEVDHIGLRSTKLTTADDTRVTVPNSEVLSGQAWNSNSGNLDCQVVTELFLPTDADPAEAMEIATEAAYSSPYLLLTKPVVVRLQDGFTEAPFLRLRVKAYVYDHRFEPAMQSDITVRAKTEFRKRGLLAGWASEKEAEAARA